MNTMVKTVGKRLKNYRNFRGLTQEALAEMADVHPTYLGQVERGEKNVTIESLEKIVASLGISFSQLFEGLDGREQTEDNIPLLCYEMIATCSPGEQEFIYKMLNDILKFKKI